MVAAFGLARAARSVGTEGILSVKRNLSRDLGSELLRACLTLQSWWFSRMFLHILLQPSGGPSLAGRAGSGRRHWRGKQDVWVQSAAPPQPSPRSPDALHGGLPGKCFGSPISHPSATAIPPTHTSPCHVTRSWHNVCIPPPPARSPQFQPAPPQA